MYVSESRVNAL